MTVAADDLLLRKILQMKFSNLLVACSLLCLSTLADAQPPTEKLYVIGEVRDKRWLTQDSRDLLDTMHLAYKAPSDFEEIMGMECFTDQPKLWSILSCATHKLQSKDGEFVAFINIFKPFTKKDSIEMKKLFPQFSHDYVDKQHISNIKGNLRGSLGNVGATTWKDYVSYLPDKEVHEKFNADTAILIPIKLDSMTYYKGTHNHLDALYLQKKGRGFVSFYMLYTDKAKKDLVKYKKAIEGIFRYKD